MEYNTIIANLIYCRLNDKIYILNKSMEVRIWGYKSI